MKRWLATLLACGAALLAPAAQATPPDVVMIDDRPFALAPGEVFVLRTAIDNLGLHSSEHSETFLVAIDAVTGAERYWLVYRARREMVFDTDLAAGRVEVTLSDREDWHDPYAIVADAGAMLAPAVMGGEGEEIARPAYDEPYTIGRDPQLTFAFTRADAAARMDRSLAMLAERVADTERMAPIDTRDLYRSRLIDQEGCAFARLGQQMEMDGPAYQIIRMDCDDGEGMEVTSLVQIILPDEEVHDTVLVP